MNFHKVLLNFLFMLAVLIAIVTPSLAGNVERKSDLLQAMRQKRKIVLLLCDSI